jgi:formylglycine-generating enzyme required for sulfatase activity
MRWTTPLCFVAMMVVALMSCARIVTDPTYDLAGTGDSRAESALQGCTPQCPEGLACTDGMCRDSAAGNCGYFAPGADSAAAMCRVPAGTYFVGCDEGMDCPTACDSHCPECRPESRPRTGRTLVADLYLDRFEVTNRRYRDYLQANPTVATPWCEGVDDLWDAKERTVADDLLEHPIVCVTVAEAEAYCEWAGKRLPVEAEWEAGARGSALAAFPWGDCFETEAAHCLHQFPNGGTYDPFFHCKNWYPEDTCAGAATTNTCDETAPVSLAGGAPSLAEDCAWGLAHMAGNAAEWAAGRWTDDHTAAGDGCDAETGACPAGPGDKRTVRGGSYREQWEHISGWYREKLKADSRVRHVGFRCGAGNDE